MNYFAKNLKYLRENKGLTKAELAKKMDINQSTICRWENEEMGVTVDKAMDVANFFNVNMAELVGKDLIYDHDYNQKITKDLSVNIPVLGIIKAGIPIEAQQDIIDYIDIPKDWLIGNKEYYALKISGNSMSPKYLEGDIVIFEICYDFYKANKKDCVVMVNGYDATFKNVSISNDGITLIPFNLNEYEPKLYTKQDICDLPVKIIGIAKEIRRKI